MGLLCLLVWFIVIWVSMGDIVAGGNLLGAMFRVISGSGVVVTTFGGVGSLVGCGAVGVYVVGGGDVVGGNLLDSLVFVVFRDGVRPVSFRSVCGLVGSSDVVGVFVDEGVARGEYDRLLKSEAICVAVRGMSVREVNDLAVAVQRIIAGRS